MTNTDQKDKWYTSQYNFIDEVKSSMHFPNKVMLYDTTLRDGEQSSGVVFRKDDKIRIARALDEVGVHRIEAGMPVISADDKAAVKEIANLGLDAEVWGFCRCVTSDVDVNLECDVDAVICEIASSDLKIKSYGFKNIEDVVERAVKTVSYAKDHGLRVAYFAVDMTRASLENLRTLYEATVNVGADELVLVDTAGVASPEAISYLTKTVKTWVDVPLQIHVHNDFGLGNACSLAAAMAGAECIHLTVNGIGERTGMADLAEVALSLNLLYGVDLGLDYGKLRGIAELVEELSQYKLWPLKPIVGDRVFTREAGPVVAQIYRGMPEAVEPFPPELVGSKRTVVLGKKSGKYSIMWKLEKLGLEATKEQIVSILSEVKAISEAKRGYLTDDEFNKILKNVIK